MQEMQFSLFKLFWIISYVLIQIKSNTKCDFKFLVCDSIYFILCCVSV